MPKSAKAFRESLKKSGVFYTPKKLAEFMRSFFPKDVPEIYDPTCGDGAPAFAPGNSYQRGTRLAKIRNRSHLGNESSVYLHFRESLLSILFVKKH